MTAVRQQVCSTLMNISSQRKSASVPSVEMFRMLGSGTEACMCAVRVARLATGHKNIIKWAVLTTAGQISLLGYACSGTLNLQSHGVPMFVFKHTGILP